MCVHVLYRKEFENREERASKPYIYRQRKKGPLIDSYADCFTLLLFHHS